MHSNGLISNKTECTRHIYKGKVRLIPNLLFNTISCLSAYPSDPCQRFRLRIRLEACERVASGMD